MSNHSPGPWRAEGQRIYAADDRHLTSFWWEITDGDPKPSDVANVALAAAAPEMLAMLERDHADASRAQWCDVCQCHEHATDCSRAALIRKAGGEP